MRSTLDNGTAVSNIREATRERYNDWSTGELKEETEWHNVVLFGRLAESFMSILRARHVLVEEGRTRRWRGRDTTEIVGSVLMVLGSGREYGSVRVQSAGLQSMARIKRSLGSSTAVRTPC